MSDTQEINLGGRPFKYLPAFANQAKKLCLLGATDEDLADFFEVAKSTINAWKHDYPKFKRALQQGKKIADIKVAESLYRQALGYSVTERTFEKSGSKDTLEATPDGELTKTDEYQVKVVKKEIAPSTPASIFWLKNRQSRDWRDKQEIEQTNRTIIVKVDGDDENTPDE